MIRGGASFQFQSFFFVFLMGRGEGWGAARTVESWHRLLPPRRAHTRFVVSGMEGGNRGVMGHLDSCPKKKKKTFSSRESQSTTFPNNRMKSLSSSSCGHVANLVSNPELSPVPETRSGPRWSRGASLP